MIGSSHDFAANARRALGDRRLQEVLTKVHGFEIKRARAVARLPEFETLREEARDLKDHVLDNLDTYLLRFEERVIAAGGQVHWCRTAEEARQTILLLCRAAGAQTMVKGKSMVAEEIGLNDFLAAHGVTPVETDLGEYIIQQRGEPPSHIIVPAVHLDRHDVEETFRARHLALPAERTLGEPSRLVDEARQILRERFLTAEVGLTGANFLIAETGSTVIVTNEGNGDLCQTLPRVHIVLAGIEKVVPTLEDAALILRLLARSATGQEFSTYTTVSTGPRRDEDADGPDVFHVVLLDNGRSDLLGSEFRDILRCIRCGACLNHCPIYFCVGGHAYGSVYPGPMGSVLTPALVGLAEAHHLPQASTLCGRCECVCPMKIPLPRLLRTWREHAFNEGATPWRTRLALRGWAWLARHPRLYRLATEFGITVLGRLGRRRGRFGWLPGAHGWTAGRDMPAPEGLTFHALWRQRLKHQREQDLERRAHEQGRYRNASRDRTRPRTRPGPGVGEPGPGVGEGVGVRPGIEPETGPGKGPGTDPGPGMGMGTEKRPSLGPGKPDQGGQP